MRREFSDAARGLGQGTEMRVSKTLGRGGLSRCDEQLFERGQVEGIIDKWRRIQ